MPPRAQPQSGSSPDRAINVPFPGLSSDFFGVEKFKGLNTKAERPAIEDEQFSWLENLMPIGDGNLRTLISNGAPIYTAPANLTIIYHFEYNIGASLFSAVFLSDGTAVAVNLASAAQLVISNIPGTFYDGVNLPGVAQFGSSGIIIVTTANAPNGYYAFDGTLYGPGSASPAWLNGGTPTTMPSGLSGTAVETYQSRVWVLNGNVGTFSGPSNGAAFSGAVGGGSFPSTDSFLKQKYVAIRQSNGFLYLFGDSSINVISNVITAGSPLTTTFNNQNVDPQVGTAWPNSVQAFSRGLVFANPSGVYVLYGGAAEKVSDDLDGIFANANFVNALIPSAAVMTINSIRVYMLLITALDYLKVTRNFLCMWDGKKWWIGSQDSALTFVSTQEFNSVLSAWGTDGASLFTLFTTDTFTLNRVLQTKLWQKAGFYVSKQAFRIYMMGKDNTGGAFTFSGTIDQVDENGPATSAVSLTSTPAQIKFYNNTGPTGVIVFQNNLGQEIDFTVPGLGIFGEDVPAIGLLLGLTLTSMSPDFTLMAMKMQQRDLAPLGG